MDESNSQTVVIKVDPETLKKKALSNSKINKIYVAPNKTSKENVTKKLNDPKAEIIDASAIYDLQELSFSLKDDAIKLSSPEKYLIGNNSFDKDLIQIHGTLKDDFQSEITEHEICASDEEFQYDNLMNDGNNSPLNSDLDEQERKMSQINSRRKREKESKIALAIEDVLKSNMSVKRAAHLHGIRYNLLVSEIKKVGSSARGALGADPALTEKEELSLVDWIRCRYKSGFPVKKIDLINRVAEIVSDGRTTRFRNGVPGEKWFINFLGRNPSVSSVGPAARFISREIPSKLSILAWFDRCQQHLLAFGQHHVLQDSKRVGSVEELTLCLLSSKTQVCRGKSSSKQYMYFPEEKSGNIHIILGACADGTMIPPMPIFACQKPPPSLINSIPSGWGIGLSKDGGINKEVIQSYLKNILIPWLTEQERLPFILFIDKLRTHMTNDTADFCSQKGLLIYNLYPNSSEILQPLHISIMEPIKKAWGPLSVHESEKTALVRFSPILDQMLFKLAPPFSIANQFRVCGIFPFSSKAPDFRKCELLKRDSNTKSFSGSDYAIALEVFEDNIGKVKSEIFNETRKGFKLLKTEDGALYKIWHKIASKVDISAHSQPTQDHKHEVILRGASRKLPKPEMYLMVNDDEDQSSFHDICNFSSITQGYFDQKVNLEAVHELDVDSPETVIDFLDHISKTECIDTDSPLFNKDRFASETKDLSKDKLLTDQKRLDKRIKRQKPSGNVEHDVIVVSKKLKAAIGPRYCNLCYNKSGKLIKCMVCKIFIHYECMMEEEQQILADLYQDDVEFDYICLNCS